MSPGAIYTPDERSKGVRLNKRTKHEQETIEGIVNETPILHVSFNAPVKDGPPFPTILPMLGTIGQYGNDEDAHLYLHGSSVARLFKLTDGNEVALCACATILDGYVMALAPFHNSCNYRSAVLFGYGTVVTDEDEIMYGLKLITNNTIPKRWENSRSPPTKSEMTSTALLKMRIETASHKIRGGGAADERFDLQNPDVVDKTWTGIVPTYLTLGEPVPSEENKVKEVPEYMADWVADANSLNEQRAIDALE
ncbi:hypothetical protein LTR37_009129 [Vermiconidia calcicola]|uniref:Uncharacterized protein n=1 Tax=Vermiconidia calcicola TaxID=1690605 RepID=A0ACC3N9Y9_9PEZI|nr:hypothetical protein LTR37_009129 [Vermiconidia calcicola]